MYVERIVKFLLWGRGGDTIYLSGKAADAMAAMLKAKYCKGGAREFDANFIYKLFETVTTPGWSFKKDTTVKSKPALTVEWLLRLDAGRYRKSVL